MGENSKDKESYMTKRDKEQLSNVDQTSSPKEDPLRVPPKSQKKCFTIRTTP